MSNRSEFTSWIMNLSPPTSPEKSKKIRKTENEIYSCQAMSWIECYDENGKWHFEFDSGSATHRGICKILIDQIEGKTSEEIQKISFSDFSGVTVHLAMGYKRTLQTLINYVKKKTG